MAVSLAADFVRLKTQKGDSMKTSSLVSLCAAVILARLYSCGDSGTKPENHTSTFHLDVGNRWQYHESKETILYNRSMAILPINYTLIRRVVGLDTLNDNAIAAIVDDSLFNVPESTNVWRLTRHWWSPDDSKLKDYGYQNFTPNDHPGQAFMNDTAVILVDYPLTEGKIWWSVYNQSYSIANTVLRRETISCAGVDFNCDVVSSSGGGGDLEADSVDTKCWYSDEGLIKQVHEAWPIDIGDYVFIDSARVIVTTELTAINLIP
jgi:hypothetical protein